jgi:hypothetical protein
MSSNTNDILIGGLSEWQDALREAQNARSDAVGISTHEFAESMGVSDSVAITRMRKLVQSAKAKHAGTRAGTRINGASYRIPVYVLVAQ